MTNQGCAVQTGLPEGFCEPVVTADLARGFGLTAEEYERVLAILARVPRYTELGIFSVMWSEHCSYKSSRKHLGKLPTSAPWVIQGPGENAGVIDIGDGQAAVFKMESHNHPSFIEPYQGAATGVGGIMRDIFTMGARPVANLNALRFGAPDNPRTRHLVAGVVAGIAGYGNCMGVPTVGGETQFHPSYNGNILVNAMTVGVVDQQKIYYSRGASAEMPVVYVGARTGRDGIHGATMASAEFESGVEGNRPTVQVGDPFTEKRLLEACLELMDTESIVCIQDMGAAGLTSSSVEIADKGKVGIHLNLDSVPQRETGMIPYELMLSESQERMLMVLKPEKQDVADAIFKKWDLECAVIGHTTEKRHLVLEMYGQIWCDIPVPPLVEEAPVYDRPYQTLTRANEPRDDSVWQAPAQDRPILESLKQLLSSPDMVSKAWIWEQYDSLVRGQTVISCGISETQNVRAGDAAIVRIPAPSPTTQDSAQTTKALALSSDCTPRYCYADPFEGGKQAVAESYRNLCATGAVPLAITNNLNFGNPEKPAIMGQFVGCIEGMAAACRALDYPVVSGNVSLYNETSGEAILPTPVIGGVGLLADSSLAMDMAFKESGETILLIGKEGESLGSSLYLHEIFGRADGAPPHVDLEREKRHGAFIRLLIAQGHISACHDISDGGLLCAIAEMILAGGTGAELTIKGEGAAFWFGEDQARYVVTTKTPHRITALLEDWPVPVTVLGHTGGAALSLEGESIPVDILRTIHESWLPTYMAGGNSSSEA